MAERTVFRCQQPIQFLPTSSARKRNTRRRRHCSRDRDVVTEAARSPSSLVADDSRSDRDPERGQALFRRR